MATEGLSVQVACRVLGVSESGYYAWRKRSPSARAVWHAWLTDRIRAVHAASRGTYGARRVQAELVLGQGIGVGHQAVERLMRVAGIQGLSGRPRYRKSAPHAAATDRVGRQFAREEPNQLWVTDITEHPTREGKVYCAVVLDVYSRRVVGWSIDSVPTAALVTNALGMALDGRGRHLLRQCPDGVVLEPRAGRVAGPPGLVHAPRAGHRALRVPRDLPQPSAPAFVARHADAMRVRGPARGRCDEYTGKHGGVRPVSRLYRTQGTPESP